METSNSFEKVKNFSIIITCLSGLIGLYVVVTNIQNTYKQSRYAGIGRAMDIVRQEDSMQDSISMFLSVFNDSTDWNARVISHKSGFAYYHSPEMRTYRLICHHYETIGTLIKADYIDFELYYQIVTFPDDFCRRTALLKKSLSDNWYGTGKPLKDFLSNFEDLKSRFIERRKLD